MKFKKIISFVMFILLGIIASCGSKDSKALVIVIGRHANANAFHNVFYEVIEKYLSETVQNGYIGIVSSEGTPRILVRFEPFEINEQNENRRRELINNNVELVLDFLKNEDNTRAITQENDLFKAIQEAKRLIDVFEAQAQRNGKLISRKQIIIMNTGIVTSGILDFSMHGIENFDFSVSDARIKAFAYEITERLNSSRELPNFDGVNISFIGLGDVATRQKELSAHVQRGIEILWETILNRANAASVVSYPYISTKKANEHTRDGKNFPEVKPIEFLENTGWTISNEQIIFDFGQWNYRNLAEAENNLKRFANIVIRHINENPDIKIYVAGSESKDVDRDYTTFLSEKRARTVMETLVKFGVPRNRMEVLGLAVYLPRRENDRPNNVFDPVIGERNQKVVLIPSNIGNQAFLQEVLATRDSLYGR